MKNRTDEILIAYDRDQTLHADFCRRLRELLEVLLRDQGHLIHSISGRVKERSSLVDKITRGKTYEQLREIHDVVGIRIITMFSEDVNALADIIRPEFTVDPANSVDKRELLDPDRFGYLSLHYVVSLSPSRQALPEYGRFEGLKAEVQIRSLLQHVWAEIEHDLGYKSKIAVPKAVQRDFSRVAGLLEIADGQFALIRKTLATYRESLAAEIAKVPSRVEINDDSLAVFARQSKLVRSVEDEISARLNIKFRFQRNYFQGFAEWMTYAGLTTISSLSQSLRENRADVLKCVVVMQKRLPHDRLARGSSLLFLAYVIAIQRGGSASLLQFFDHFNIGFAAINRPFAEALDREILGESGKARSKVPTRVQRGRKKRI